MGKRNQIQKSTLTTGEIAVYCGVHYRTVIRWIELGQLKAYKLPGRGDHRVSLEHFIEFLRNNHIPLPAALAGNAGSEKKILIVDDDKSLVRSLSRLLKSAGYEIQHASDGFQAGILLATFRPHIMTLDINMPGANGRDVLQFVADNSDLISNIRILVLTASNKNEIRDMMKLGADAAIQKPFDRNNLLSTIDNLLK